MICQDLSEPDPVEVTVKRQGNLKNAENEEDEESKFLHEKNTSSNNLTPHVLLSEYYSEALGKMVVYLIPNLILLL